VDGSRCGLGEEGSSGREEGRCWGQQGAGTEAAVLAQRVTRGEGLAAVLALDLLTTESVHTFMATQVGELRVGLAAYLTLEWFDAVCSITATVVHDALLVIMLSLLLSQTLSTTINIC
jgi:hypothetical protein